MSINLGTLSITGGTPTQFQGAPSDGSKAIVIGNESGLTCTIKMQGGNVEKTLYPGVVDWFAVKRGFTGTILVSPTAILSNASTFPASELIFDAIGINDDEDASMYPVALSRNTNIGNTVNTVGTGNATAIINDGSVVGAGIIEATPAGDGHSAVTLNNIGQLVLGDVTHPGSISSDNGKLVTDGTGFLTALTLLLTGGKIGKSAVGDILDFSASNQTILKTLGADLILKSSATEIARFIGQGNGEGSLSLPGAATAVLNGSTSGTAQGFLLFNNANFKMFIVFESNLRNGNVGQQNLSIPSAGVFTTQVNCLVIGGTNQFQIVNGGSAQTCAVLTGLPSAGSPGGGGTTTNSTNIGSWTFCNVSGGGGADTIAFNGSEASGHTGVIFLFGS